jgi:hypothetical protein
MKYTALIFMTLACLTQIATFGQNTPDFIHVLPTQDFKISCNDISKNWENAQWNELVSDHADPRATRVKTLYSQTGIYFLYFNEDKKPTSTKKNDFDSLWVEDVAEVFLWPDTSMTVYFEYEIAPTNRELVLIIPNFQGRFLGWIPWNYRGTKRIQHCTKIIKEKKGSNEPPGWYAEFFVPYEILSPMVAEIPKAGSVWRANFYRADYDDNKTTEWSWKLTKKTFHEFNVFGRLIFD